MTLFKKVSTHATTPKVTFLVENGKKQRKSGAVLQSGLSQGGHQPWLDLEWMTQMALEHSFFDSKIENGGVFVNLKESGLTV